MHTLMIKGINPDVSPESASRGISRVFAPRFGAHNILKVQLFRPFDNIKLLIKKRKTMKKKLKTVTKANSTCTQDEERVKLTIGSLIKCNKQ